MTHRQPSRLHPAGPGALLLLLVLVIGLMPMVAVAQTETTIIEPGPDVSIDGVDFSFWFLSQRLVVESTTSVVAATPSPDVDAATSALNRVTLLSPSGNRSEVPWVVSDVVDGDQWFAARVALDEIGRWEAIGPTGPVATIEVIGEPVAGSSATAWYWAGGIALVVGFVLWERIRVGRSKEADELRASANASAQDSWWLG